MICRAPEALPVLHERNKSAPSALWLCNAWQYKVMARYVLHLSFPEHRICREFHASPAKRSSLRCPKSLFRSRYTEKAVGKVPARPSYAAHRYSVSAGHPADVHQCFYSHIEKIHHLFFVGSFSSEISASSRNNIHNRLPLHCRQFYKMMGN